MDIITSWDIADKLFGYGATVVAAGAVYVAWQGLSTWRKEVIGRKKAELAEEFLAGAYEAKDKLASIRSGMCFPDSESSARPRTDSETKEENRRLDSKYVPIARILKASSFFSELFAKKYRVKAYFGVEAEKSITMIHECLHRVRVVAEMLYDEPAAGGGYNAELRSKLQGDIWQGIKQPDEISDNMDEAISIAEKACASILSERK